MSRIATSCQPAHDIIDIEHAIDAGADIIDLEELL